MANIQNHYRWRNDDGSESGATWKANEDTEITAVSKLENIRLRLEVARTSGGQIKLNAGLEYSLDEVVWIPIIPVSGGGEHWQLSPSPNFNDLDITTAQLTATGNFVPGFMIEFIPQAPTITIKNGEYTEMEYCIQATSDAINGQKYYFRIVDGGVPLDTYLHAEATIGGAVLDQKHFRFFDDDDAINDGTALAAEDTDIIDVEKEVNFRLRYGIHNIGDIAKNVTRSLEWRKEGSVGWLPVIGSGPVKMAASSEFADGDATTERLTADGDTFMAGQGKEDDASTTLVDLTDAYKVEDEWCLVFDAAAEDNTSYEFRVVDVTVSPGGDELEVYSVIAKATTETPPASTFNQIHGRFYDDDGAINAGTPLAAEDTNIEDVAKSTNFRIRYAIADTGGAEETIIRRLQFRKKLDLSWTDVPTLGLVVVLVNSPNFADQDATTNRLSLDGRTFVAGEGVEATGGDADTEAVEVNPAYQVEDEWVIEFGVAAENFTSYEFRVVEGDGPSDPFTDYPVILEAKTEAVIDWADYGEVLIEHDSSKYGTTEIFLEAHLKTSNAVFPCFARLYNVTDSVPVDGSEINNPTTSTDRIRSEAITLLTDKEYKIQFGGMVGVGTTFTCVGAQLIIDNT